MSKQQRLPNLSRAHYLSCVLFAADLCHTLIPAPSGDLQAIDFMKVLMLKGAHVRSKGSTNIWLVNSMPSVDIEERRDLYGAMMSAGEAGLLEEPSDSGTVPLFHAIYF